MTPSSAARMLFSPSLKPTVSPTTSTQEHLAQLTLLEQINSKRAAAAAAAQEPQPRTPPTLYLLSTRSGSCTLLGQNTASSDQSC